MSLKNESDKVVVFERAGLLFIFNCECGSHNVMSSGLIHSAPVHSHKSFTDYRVGVEVPGDYKVVLSSDEKRFGGHDRIDMNGKYFTTPMEWNGRKNWLQVSQAVSPPYLDSDTVSRSTPQRGRFSFSDDHELRTKMV